MANERIPSLQSALPTASSAGGASAEASLGAAADSNDPQRDDTADAADEGAHEALNEPESLCRRVRTLTTGDLARACDTTVRTVRFYEEAGVLCPETRSEGGHRLFGRDELAKLQLIMDLREAGLSLNDIKALFELKRKSATPQQASEAMSKVLENQIDEMQRKIATLRRLREELAQTVAILEECKACGTREFPTRCGTCDVMNRSDLPRAMRLLWGC